MNADESNSKTIRDKLIDLEDVMIQHKVIGISEGKYLHTAWRLYLII